MSAFTRDTPANRRRRALCALQGHSWRLWTEYTSVPFGPWPSQDFRTCNLCQITERIESPAATAAPISQEGGEIMENITVTVDGVEYNLVPVNGVEASTPRTLSIKRPFVVYDVNGDRVDGYKYESRARRNNDARFAGTGYWLGRADTGVFEFVSA